MFIAALHLVILFTIYTLFGVLSWLESIQTKIVLRPPLLKAGNPWSSFFRSENRIKTGEKFSYWKPRHSTSKLDKQFFTNSMKLNEMTHTKKQTINIQWIMNIQEHNYQKKKKTIRNSSTINWSYSSYKIFELVGQLSDNGPY